MSKPFWEKSYKNGNVSTFGIKPNPIIQERWSLFKKNGIILDAGCGEGQNSIFLAQKGFAVDAFDISDSGIEKLKRLAMENHVKVSAWIRDLRKFEFEKNHWKIGPSKSGIKY